MGHFISLVKGLEPVLHQISPWRSIHVLYMFECWSRKEGFGSAILFQLGILVQQTMPKSIR
jgi:hypothetical protein